MIPPARSGSANPGLPGFVILGALFFATAATHLVHIALYRQALTANILPKIWRTVFSPSEYFCVRSRMTRAPSWRSKGASEKRRVPGAAAALCRRIHHACPGPAMLRASSSVSWAGVATLAAAPFLDIK